MLLGCSSLQVCINYFSLSHQRLWVFFISPAWSSEPKFQNKLASAISISTKQRLVSAKFCILPCYVWVWHDLKETVYFSRNQFKHDESRDQIANLTKIDKIVNIGRLNVLSTVNIGNILKVIAICLSRAEKTGGWFWSPQHLCREYSGAASWLCPTQREQTVSLYPSEDIPGGLMSRIHYDTCKCKTL